MGSVSVIVVAYGPVEHLRRCLASLSGCFPVTVVDNGMSDEAAGVCARAGAAYIRPPRNLGFGAAINVALSSRSGYDVLLLNPDAEIEPSAVRLLHRRLRSAGDLAAVAPKLLNTDGSPQKVEWPVPSPRTVWADVIGRADRSQLRFLSGAVLMLRAECLESIGVFDERFFLYAEETDWQVRAQKAGWRIAVVDEACAVHVSGGTSLESGTRELLFNASAERLVRKWYGPLGWQVFRAGSTIAAARRLILARTISVRRQQWRVIRHYIRGPVRSAEMAGAPGYSSSHRS